MVITHSEKSSEKSVWIARFCMTNLDVELEGEDGLEAGRKRAFWETMSFLLFESGLKLKEKYSQEYPRGFWKK